MKMYVKNIILGVGIVFVAMFFCVINVDARTRCSDQVLWELQQAARQVRSTIELVEGTHYVDLYDDHTGERVTAEFAFYEFRISTFNISDDLFVRMINSATREATTINSQMLEDGVFVYMTDNTSDLVNYSFRVYTNNEGCFGHHFRTYTVRKPMWNMFASFEICLGNSDIPYCQKFIDRDLNISEFELVDRINRLLGTPEEEDDDNRIIEWLRGNTVTIIIIILVIGAGSGGVYLFIRHRRSI